ncbi:MAG: SH3 domain-containing protein [Defluviitaleaceae bacterium]|nr:SH3 domain-containing protein [Defluviitaleaceae bacterium]
MKNPLRKVAALLTAGVMALGIFAVPMTARAEAYPEYATRIDILHHADYHGFIDGFVSASDPGAALFAAFSEFWASQNPNRDNVVMVAGGDNYHGHPVSNFLMGEPTVWLYDFLGVNYSSLGNHEFSFGSVERASEFGESITFLAADLFVAGTNDHPDWVQPYTIIERDGAVVAMVGLMTSGMSHLVSNAILSNFDLRTPTIGAYMSDGEVAFADNFNEAWVNDIEVLIQHLRDYYGAGAVVALTHMGTGGGHGAEAEVLAHLVDGFDAIIAGHTHLVTNRTVNGTMLAEAGWHGRTLGRLSFFFDEDGNMISEVRSEMTGPANIDGEPNPYSILNFHTHYAFQNDNVQAVYNAVSAQVDLFWDEAGTFLNQVVGQRGTPGAPEGIEDNTVLRNHRNQWVTELVQNHVIRNTTDADWTNTVLNDWVYISNFGGWRNMGPWHWEAGDDVTMLDMIATMPFNNAVLLFEMYGRDLVTLMSMEAGGATMDPPEFGLNGGQPAVVSGAVRGERVDDFVYGGVARPRYTWYFANGEPINDDDTIYRVIGSNFIWGGFGSNGGDRFPFPGNNHGDALGMTFISEPFALLADGSLVAWTDVPTDSTIWEEFGLMLLRDAMIETLQHRAGGNFQDIVTLPADIEGLEEYEYEYEVESIEEVEETPVVEEVPIVEETPVVEEIPVAVEAPAPSGTGTVVNAWYLNVRANASSDATPVGVLRRDDVVTVLESVGTTHVWHRIQLGELTGWVFGRYLELNA